MSSTPSHPKSITEVDFVNLGGSCFSMAQIASHLLVLDNYNKTIIKVDREDIHKKSSVLLEQHLIKPNVIGLNDQEIFVVGEASMVVFDHNFKFKRKFEVASQLRKSESMTVDDKFVYVAHQDDRVTKWNCESGELVKEARVTNPGNLDVHQGLLYVISQAYAKRDDGGRVLKEIESGLNCVLVLETISLEVVREVSFDNWIQPTSLLFWNGHLLVAAFEVEKNGLISKCKQLYSFLDGKYVNQLEMKQIESVEAMSAVGNELYVVTFTNEEMYGLVKLKIEF